MHTFFLLRAILHSSGGGSQVGEVTRLGGGNPPVHTISPFNLMTFKWLVGLPDRVTPHPPPPPAGIEFCHANVSRWGSPPSQGRIRDTSNSRKIHLSGGL